MGRSKIAVRWPAISMARWSGSASNSDLGCHLAAMRAVGSSYDMWTAASRIGGLGEAERRDRHTLIEEAGDTAKRGLQHEFFKYPL
jgi:hypothetical protein